MASPDGGGFVQPQVLSPPATSAASSVTSPLPQPRSHPLKYGSPKESAFIRYMDENLNRIQRRFAKRTATVDAGDDSKGYENFKELASDIERLIDVAWVSGTPSLQIPYLLSLALLTVDSITGITPSPKAMFRLLDKLDLAFASLIQGTDLQTGEALPGFATGRRVNVTEKVRIKSLVERTRITVVGVMSSGDIGDDEEDDESAAEQSMDESAADDRSRFSLDDEVDGWEMEIAKVYDRTMIELGDTIGGTPIGIITEN